MHKKQLGITLLEALLVMGIAASILILGLRQYTVFKSAGDVSALQANVDHIFAAMSSYYKRNCYGYRSFSGGIEGPVVYGTLNPLYTPTPPTNKVIDIQTDLINTGYLNTLPLNPLVDYDAAAGPYVVQFNKFTSVRTACTAGSGSTCSQTTPIGTVIVWQMQVAVALKTTEYESILGANCLSTVSGSMVVPCTGVSTGTYAVWQRLPNLGSSTYNSTYWLSMPLVKQFTQEYTTLPMVYLIGAGGSGQYIYCGG